jgi:hypothetical protein
MNIIREVDVVSDLFQSCLFLPIFASTRRLRYIFSVCLSFISSLGTEVVGEGLVAYIRGTLSSLVNLCFADPKKWHPKAPFIYIPFVFFIEPLILLAVCEMIKTRYRCPKGERI